MAAQDAESVALETVKQVGARLHVSRPTIYKLLEAKEIKSIKIGTARRIISGSVDAYIERQANG